MTAQFEPEDLDLLVIVTNLNPRIATTAQLGRILRQISLQFPVKSAEELAPLFQRAASVIGDYEYFSMEWVQQNFPSGFFPMTSEVDFLEKIYRISRVTTTPPP